MAIEENKIVLPPAPEGRPPSIHESIEYQRHLHYHLDVVDENLIPSTVTDLYTNASSNGQQHGKIVEDLYRILMKVTNENKNLRLTLSEQQEIIENEVRVLRDLE